MWQAKGLRTAKNEILAGFSYVWQEKELALKVPRGLVASQRFFEVGLERE